MILLFPLLFIEIDPDILRFKSQPVLGIWSSLVVLNSIQRFYPVRIRSKLACFFLAYVPENPNMFSASAPSSETVSMCFALWDGQPVFFV